MARLILVPLDGSPAAEAAVWHAAAMAGALADGVLLLQVLEPPDAPSEVVVSDLDWRFLRAEANAYLRSVASRLVERGIDARTLVAVGSAADEIVRYARRDDIALVVLASHGRGVASAFAFGGTTHKVLSLAPASVMVVRPGDEGDAAPVVRYRQILVPVDGSPAAEWALGLAATVARPHEAAMLVLHLVPEAPAANERIPRTSEESELLARLMELQSERGRRYLAELEARFAHAEVPVASRLGYATRLAERISEVASAAGVDLIALAAHGSGGAVCAYGAVAQRLLTECDLPVVVFQDVPLGRRGVRARRAERPSSPTESPERQPSGSVT
jgi:nucleotide-binding universal stress UspA family protein